MEDENKKFPEGHFVGMWMGIGMAIFSGIGIPLSIALKMPGFIAIGPGIGIAFGLIIGQSIETKHKKEGKIRELTEKEKSTRKKLVYAGIGLLAIGVLAFLAVFFSIV
ncbi:MAG: hypothetical protein HN704_00900 [Bacteroidetes bacterium]|jgi:hypothetical protein|nr:hypothetical protein [Bacteroidota bacterium]MBT6685548.1 hypothetical protein [Bacteroidota bacterium]MBT7142258.1 hypothetical protein [Bacteroidota bacterium]MBT7490142.1 hypothetical protein [Bacteroidota bacterium]